MAKRPATAKRDRSQRGGGQSRVAHLIRVAKTSKKVQQASRCFSRFSPRVIVAHLNIRKPRVDISGSSSSAESKKPFRRLKRVREHKAINLRRFFRAPPSDYPKAMRSSRWWNLFGHLTRNRRGLIHVSLTAGSLSWAEQIAAIQAALRLQALIYTWHLGHVQPTCTNTSLSCYTGNLLTRIMVTAVLLSGHKTFRSAICYDKKRLCCRPLSSTRSLWHIGECEACGRQECLHDSRSRRKAAGCPCPAVDQRNANCAIPLGSAFRKFSTSESQHLSCWNSHGRAISASLDRRLRMKTSAEGKELTANTKHLREAIVLRAKCDHATRSGKNFSIKPRAWDRKSL